MQQNKGNVEMAKSLKELSDDLKAIIIDLQSDAHNKSNLRPERYNNLKLSMDPAKDRTPHVIINITMSEAQFNVTSGEKMNGSLGPDERYVIRWFNKSGTLQALQETWKSVSDNEVKNRSKK